MSTSVYACAGFWRQKAEICVNLVPRVPGDDTPISPIGRPRRICHLRASSRHIDENTDLSIANEYCGGEVSPAQADAEFSDTMSPQSPANPGIFVLSSSECGVGPGASAAAHKGEHKLAGLFASWPSPFRAIRPRAAAAKPDHRHQDETTNRKQQATHLYT